MQTISLETIYVSLQVLILITGVLIILISVLQAQLCNFQPPEQYTKTLKLAVYDIIDLHEFANYQYMVLLQ
jgi:hypothetical protein